MTAVSIRELGKAYGASRVIDSLDLEVEEGEFLALLGPSGCGKTTTLRCVAGLERPDSGSIAFGDRVMVEPERRAFVPPERRNVAMVFQSYALWPHMSVFSNVAYSLRLRHTQRSEISARVERALEQVGLAGLGDRTPGTLSGGQQQRVALARAVASDPAVLLFDEPLSNLDTKLRATMRAEIKRIHRATATTTLYVTHDQVEALTLADRVVVINRGRVEQIGTPHEIFTRPANRFVADFVGYEVILEGRVRESNSDGSAIVEVVSGTVEIAHADDFRQGDPVLLGARSRACELRRGHPSGSGWLPGTLLEISEVGDEIEAFVQLESGPVVVRFSSDLPQQEFASLGEPIAVKLPKHTTVALPHHEKES